MVWKQDLAKLKQQFKDEGESNPKAAVPKPIPKPPITSNLSIEEQDDLFLNAMGQKSVPKTQSSCKLVSVAEGGSSIELLTSQGTDSGDDFQAMMGGLKGLKPLTGKIPASEPEVKRAEPEVIPLVAVPESVPPPVILDSCPPALPSRALPERIQLAAGMAIEVDGFLDLRGHSTVDALERFKERLQDGVFLGWRTFHVIFGTSEELGIAFQEFLSSPEAHVIVRFAQAPIPMGGPQAWILYFGPSGH
ncbi:MAG: hypothetical protein Q8O00_14530 [Holophaga sp.]|nr:hypothetical protein [Holophaga sp.]